MITSAEGDFHMSPRASRRLARAVINLAIKDLDSNSYYLQRSAIQFFEDEELRSIYYSLADLGEPTSVPEYTPVPKPDPNAPPPPPKSRKKWYDVYRFEQFIGRGLGIDGASEIAGCTLSNGYNLASKGGKSETGHQIVKTGRKPKALLIRCYKDGLLHRTVAGLAVASRMSGLAVETIWDMLKSKEEKLGWRFERENESRTD